MLRSRHSGFSLVELMVAAVIGIIGTIIIFQVFSVFEGQKRTTTSGGDAETNTSIAMSAIEQAAQQSGYGLNFASHLGCTVYQWRDPSGDPDPTPPATRGTFSTMVLAPVLLERNPDATFKSITFVRTRGDTSYAVTQLKENMPAADSDIKVQNIYGFRPGHVLILAEKKDTVANKINKITCAVTDVRELPLPSPNPPGPPVNTIPDRIVHTWGEFYGVPGSCPGPSGAKCFTQYNKKEARGLGSLDTTPPTPVAVADADTRFKFTAKAYVMNVGNAIQGADWSLSRTQFSLSNGQLLEGDPTVTKAFPLVEGVVFMDAQLGLAATAKHTTSENSVTYVKEMPKNADTSVEPQVDQQDWFRLRTVRVAMVIRGSQFDKEYTSPSSYSFWSGGLAATYVVPSSDRNYRHKIVDMVIPLRNFYWRP